jgi:dipeptidyl aminopeptidase/acylaminoacyl peptidase
MTTGQTLTHRYRGTADSDLNVTPQRYKTTALLDGAGSTTGSAGSTGWTSSPQATAPQASSPPAGPAPGAAPAGSHPQAVGPSRDAEATWPGRKVSAADDPFGEPDAPPKAVNVFGEVDGAPPPRAGAANDAGFQQHTFTDVGGDADVCVDPTGKWLLYSSTRNSERPYIYMQRVDGTSVIELTGDAGGDAYPCFSPDGKQIAFASTRSGPWQIYLMDSDGRNVVQVTNGTMQCVHPSFSPDGTRVVYAAIGSKSNQWELWTVNLSSNEKRMIGYGLFPRWSPDKTVDRIAFQRARQRGSRWFSLWALDLIEGEGHRLTEIAASSNAAIISPTWNPDGSRLTFATIVEPAAAPASEGVHRPRGNAPPAPARHGRQDIWTINADGSNRQRLTDGNGTNLSPWWAPDNRVYFISDRGGAECVWSVRADPAREPAVAVQKPAAPDKGAAAATDPRDPGQ